MGTNTNSDDTNIITTLAELKKSFDERFDRIDEQYSVITGITQTAEFAKTLAESNKQEIDELRDDIKNLTKLCTSLQSENQKLKFKTNQIETHTNNLDTYSRRDNLIIYGIEEPENETQASLLTAVRDFFCKQLGMTKLEANKIRFVRYHRLYGGSNNGITKPVILRFSDYSQRNAIWLLKTKLGGQNHSYHMSEDFPNDIAYRRRKLLPIFNRARKSGKYVKGSVSLKADTLYIDGQQYGVDNLHLLEGDLNPIKFCEKSNDNTVAFGGLLSDYHHGSNFKRSPFTYNGTLYEHVEQAFVHVKATTFGDKSIAATVMQTESPAKCKALGKKIKGFKKQQWYRMNIEIMTELVTAKYKQNADLAAELLSTDEKNLCESGRDIFWGTGISITNDNVLDESVWKGQNQLGKILQEVRQKLRSTS